MNLLNNDLKSILKDPEQVSEESLNDEYIESLLELNESLEDIEQQDAMDRDLNTLCEIKNHIDKYGVSEETLSLFGKDLAKLGIVEDTSKEVALETIDDVVTQNSDTEISEELNSDSIFILMLYANTLWNINPILIIVSALIIKYKIYSDNSEQILIKLTNKLQSNGFKLFAEKKTKLRIPPKDKFLTQVNGCESILKFISELSPEEAVKTEFSQKESLLTPLGYSLDDGNVVKTKEKVDKIILSDNGYTEKSIKILIDKGITLCSFTMKFKKLASDINVLTKKKAPAKNDDTKTEKISDEEKSQIKTRVKEYKEFMKVGISSSKYVIMRIISLGKATIK